MKYHKGGRGKLSLKANIPTVSAEKTEMSEQHIVCMTLSAGLIVGDKKTESADLDVIKHVFDIRRVSENY